MKQILKIVGLFLALAVVILLATKSSGTQTDDPIRIGASLSLTGFAANAGEHSLNAQRLAVEEINRAGGINGRMVELVVENDQTDAVGAINAYKKLTIIDKVDGIIGGLWTFTQEPIQELAVEDNLVILSPTNVRIEGSFEPADTSFFMLTNFDTIISGLERFLLDQDFEKLAVIRFTSDFGREISETLAEIMLREKGVTSIDETYGQLGGNDFSTTISKLKKEGVDVVFLDMVDIDLFSFIKKARELDFNPTIISHSLVYDALKNQEIDGLFFEGVVVLDWELSPQSFVEKYKDAYGTEPAYAASKSYDAVYVLAEALSNTKDGESVSDYIEKTSFTTPNGTISFTSDHTISDTPVAVRVIQNGQPVLVE